MITARTARSIAHAHARGTGPARRRFSSTPSGVVTERSVSSPGWAVALMESSAFEIDVAVGGVDRRDDHRAQHEPAEQHRYRRNDRQHHENGPVDDERDH